MLFYHTIPSLTSANIAIIIYIMNNRIKTLCRCALFSALIAICSIITIPIAPVPVNLAFFGLLLTAFLLPANDAVISTAVYIALGLMGLPVFAGMQGGLGVLAGATGGFIMGYLPMVICVSVIKGDGNSPFKSFAAILAGYFICYTFGVLWLTVVSGTRNIIPSAITVLPLIPADIIKAAGALIVIRKIKGRF